MKIAIFCVIFPFPLTTFLFVNNSSTRTRFEEIEEVRRRLLEANGTHLPAVCVCIYIYIAVTWKNQMKIILRILSRMGRNCTSGWDFFLSTSVEAVLYCRVGLEFVEERRPRTEAAAASPYHPLYPVPFIFISIILIQKTNNNQML